nr:tyrosine-type recombinase/integrase [Actinomadura graeca]
MPLLADPWPGRPLRGRNAHGRAEACWTPLSAGLTPHGLRHSHRTMLEEDGIPPVLIDERMGHEDGSVQRRYTHVTAPMRRRLVGELTVRWEAALAARLALCPASPVPVLDELLRAWSQARERGRSQDRPTDLPQRGVPAFRARPRKRSWPASGRRDLNPRPLDPQDCGGTGLPRSPRIRALSARAAERALCRGVHGVWSPSGPQSGPCRGRRPALCGNPCRAAWLWAAHPRPVSCALARTPFLPAHPVCRRPALRATGPGPGVKVERPAGRTTLTPGSGLVISDRDGGRRDEQASISAFNHPRSPDLPRLIPESECPRRRLLVPVGRLCACLPLRAWVRRSAACPLAGVLLAPVGAGRCCGRRDRPEEAAARRTRAPAPGPSRLPRTVRASALQLRQLAAAPRRATRVGLMTYRNLSQGAACTGGARDLDEGSRGSGLAEVDHSSPPQTGRAAG